MNKALGNGLQEIMDTVQSISGIMLGPDKRGLVETRLLRRVRFLGLSSIEDYYNYFQENRKTEIKEIVSLITTHTTSFFREEDHFDYLFEKLFPEALARKRNLRIWSAACSTGEEAYSLAIAYLEFLEKKGVPLERAPQLEVFGSDIDHVSVEKAKAGIYEKDRLRDLREDFRRKYFDRGSGAIANLYRVKDRVHGLCHFQQGNLLSPEPPLKDVDIIFLRNVLIYFKSEDVKRIVTSLERSLTDDGYLFIGHSESISSLGVPYKVVGNSIYQTLRASESKAVALVPSQANVGSDATPARTKRKLRVMIVDDSATIRHMLRKILSADEGFEVAAEAENGQVALEKVKSQPVDVMTLDIHMPVMDGISYLKKLRGQEHPPIVMLSSVCYEDGTSVMNALELGASEYIEKPAGLDLAAEAERIRQVLRSVATSKKRHAFKERTAPSSSSTPPFVHRSGMRDLILIGASTGGIEALTSLLMAMPKDIPPICIVQHIPKGFSTAFAKHLAGLVKPKVVEAEGGELLENGTIYLAPGGRQMRLAANGRDLRLHVNDDAPLNRHRPSVDYLFQSAAELKAPDLTISAALLTGMGQDGAAGLKRLKDTGAHTIAQNEETCVVFGMPRAAIEREAVHEVLPLESIAYHLIRSLSLRKVG